MKIRRYLQPTALAVVLAMTLGCGGGGGGSSPPPGGSNPPPTGGGDPPPPTATPDTKPDAFAFAPAGNLFLDMAVTSQPVAIKGIDAPAAVTVSGGEYAINNQPFTTAAGKINAGDTVRVRTSTAAAAEKTVEAVLDIGGVKGAFAVTTGPAVNFADIDPDPFQVAEPAAVEKGKLVTSDVFTVTGINAPTPISILGGEYRIEGGDFTSEPGVVLPGQRVQVHATAPEQDGTVVVATLRIGGVVETFALTTLAADGAPDTVPNFFAFAPIFDAEPDANVDSESITIGGISADAPVHVEGGEYSLGAEFTTADGTVSNGGTVTLRARSSAVSGGLRAVTLYIGGVPAVFLVGTREIDAGSDAEPDALTFTPVQTAQAAGLIVSEWVTPANFNAPATVMVEDGEYQLDGGAFTAQPQLMLPGQSIRLRGIAPQEIGNTQQVLLNVSGSNSVFEIELVAAGPTNQPPIVSAGVFQVGNEIHLDALDSTDPDGDAITVTWEQVVENDAPALPINVDEGSNNRAYAVASFTVSGTYKFKVTVADGQDSVTETFELTVTSPDNNTPPVANAGSDVAVNLTDGATLNASASVDDDGDTLTYSWLQLQGPAPAIIVTPSSETSLVTFSAAGVYEFQVTVDDGKVADEDQVLVTVNPLDEPPPVETAEICVVNENNSTVAVFPSDANGNVPPLRRLGNLAGLDHPQAVAYDALNDEIYVTNASVSPDLPAYPVVVFQHDANGNVAPVRFIGGPNTGLGTASGIAIDAVNNEVFVSTPGKVLAFPREAHGNVEPLRTLDTCSGCAPGIAVDPAHAELFVPFPFTNEIRVYDRMANGTNVTPKRVIEGQFTELNNPVSVAYDNVHDELVVYSSNNNLILMFDREPEFADIFPNAEIDTSTLAGLTNIRHIAIDGNNNEIFVTSAQGVAVFERIPDSFDPQLAKRLISGSGAGFEFPVGIAVKPGAELFITDANASRLIVHSETADGDVPPLRVVSGREGGLDYPRAIATAEGLVFVANANNDSVPSYDNPWSETPVPRTFLQGSGTGFDWTTGVAVKEDTREVFVTNSLANTITVHSFDDNGDVPPLRTIASGSSSRSPFAVDVDRNSGDIFVGNNDKTITVYAADATGNAIPDFILGPSAFMDYPISIDFDESSNGLFVLSSNITTKKILFFAQVDGGVRRTISGDILGGTSDILVDGDEIFVADYENDAILVFPATSDGEVTTPSRIISGDKTMLSQPIGIDRCR